MTTDIKLSAVQQVAENSRKELRLKRLNANGVLADSQKPVVVGVADGGVVPVTILKSAAAQAGTTTVARQPDLPITVTVFAWEFPSDRDEVVIEGYAFQEGIDDPDAPDSWAWVEWLRQPAPPVSGRPTQWNVTLPAGRLTDILTTGSASPTQWKIPDAGHQ